MVGGHRLSTQDATFHRHLSPEFLDALEALVDQPEGDWWRDVLVHPDLFIAVRNNSLNVYYRGASIFRIVPEEDRPVPETHVKYLLRQRQAYVKMAVDGRFQFCPAESMWTAYEKRTTLEEMIRAARAYAGAEKTGLHALIMANPNVIDVEAAFWHTGSDTNEVELPDASNDDDDGRRADSNSPEDTLSASSTPAGRKLDRIDAVSLEDRDGELWIVFHEAKHFANKELRGAEGRPPPVTTQIARYRQAITRYTPDIGKAYSEVCQALVRLHGMQRRAVRPPALKVFLRP